MIKRILIVALALQSIAAFVQADNRSLLLQNTQPQHIFINNRILAQVNGKPISVIDLMKKMDMVFYRQYPQYSSSIEARYQFYNMSWKHVLKELIEKELIMSDAVELKVEISNGDVRQEMENLFGPNIIGNLDKAGLSYEEASKLIKEELTLKRMMAMRVHSKASRAVTPQDVRVAYETYAKENLSPDSWRYQVISIKGKDAEACAEAANYAYQLAAEARLPIEQIGKELENHALIGKSVDCTISEEYVGTAKELSESYRQILSTLQNGTFSHPIAQDARGKNLKVFRIFYLKEFTPAKATPLPDVEAKLKNQLIDAIINVEGEQYLNKLREHFDIQGGDDKLLYTEDFQPFVLK